MQLHEVDSGATRLTILGGLQGLEPAAHVHHRRRICQTQSDLHTRLLTATRLPFNLLMEASFPVGPCKD